MQKTRVLIVENDNAVAENLAQTLKSAGIDVAGMVATGEESVDAVSRAAPDLVLMDIMLDGDMDGTGAAELIRSRHDIPVIFVTGYADDATMKRARISEPFAYILKPFDERELQINVRVALYKHSMERKLRESEARFRTLYEHAPVMIGGLDPEGRCVLWNLELERQSGWGAEEALAAENPLQLLVSDPAARSRLERASTEEDDHFHEYRIRTRDGSERCQMWAAFSLPGGARILLGYDITERKRAEAEQEVLQQRVQQTQKMESLANMAGGIAHDFNNLLQGIMGYADLALGGTSSNSMEHMCLQEIQAASRRAAELSGQMLAYSGRGSLMLKPLNLSALIRNLTSLQQANQHPDICVAYELQENLPSIAGDDAQLRQAIINLVTNAAEAVGEAEAGAITVRTGTVQATREMLAATYVDDEIPAGAYVSLEVQDTGCGMDGAMLENVFDPFYTTKFTGRGLGLAAVLGIVRGHRGAISVKSVPGTGTTFRALFPAVEEKVAAEVAAADDATWQGKGTVLLVDDERVVRETGALLLERMGFRVLTASDGREAVDLFREQPDSITCVLLDLAMPEMDGKATFRVLRQLREDVKVILTTGFDEEKVWRQFDRTDLLGVIQKPYRVNELQAKMREFLEGE